MNEILLLENKILEYDIFKPVVCDWWKMNENARLDILYSVKLFDKKISTVIKYLPDGNYILSDSF